MQTLTIINEINEEKVLLQEKMCITLKQKLFG